MSVYLRTPELIDLSSVLLNPLPNCTHIHETRVPQYHSPLSESGEVLLSSRRVCSHRAGFSGLQWTLKRRACGSVTPFIPLEDSGSATMAAVTQQMSSLPSGLRICTTAPDILYLPELVRERNI